MTILEPILYANGALRLTRHGAGKGGNVLVLEHPDGRTEQVELSDADVDTFDNLVGRYAAAIAPNTLDESDAGTIFRAATKTLALT